MNPKFVAIAVFALLCSSAYAEDEDTATKSGKNEARLLIGKHVRIFELHISFLKNISCNFLADWYSILLVACYDFQASDKN